MSEMSHVASDVSSRARAQGGFIRGVNGFPDSLDAIHYTDNNPTTISSETKILVKICRSNMTQQFQLF